MAEENREKPQGVDLTTLEIDQILGLFIGILAAKAWQYMGYRLAPGREEAEKDLTKASAAIDCVAFLAEKLTPFIPEAEAHKLRAMIADLQINFARSS